MAGWPLLIGSAVMEGFTPDEDATVVTRMLDAGAEIAGKATCENMSFSGGSNTSFPEPVRNPRDPTRMAGGSSSGSAALIASGQCELAIGGDVGGSIRLPSSWCGVVGLKPTFGLVPFTGVNSQEASLEVIGPMAATAADAAILLDVIAGQDGIDSRQGFLPPKMASAMSCIEKGCDGLRIGLLEEGFGWPGSEDDVDAAVERAASVFGRLGAKVSRISVPLHRDGADILTAVCTEGTWVGSIRDAGVNFGLMDSYDVPYIDFFRDACRERANDFPPSLKVTILAGVYINNLYHARYYAKAQNLRRTLRLAYEEALQKVDILLMPTTPQKAIGLDQDRSLEEEFSALDTASRNTCPFNLSGHPALSVPCGTSSGLPIGMMLVGRPFEDATTLRVAHAYEVASP